MCKSRVLSFVRRSESNATVDEEPESRFVQKGALKEMGVRLSVVESFTKKQWCSIRGFAAASRNYSDLRRQRTRAIEMVRQLQLAVMLLERSSLGNAARIRPPLLIKLSCVKGGS